MSTGAGRPARATAAPAEELELLAEEEEEGDEEAEHPVLAFRLLPVQLELCLGFCRSRLNHPVEAGGQRGGSWGGEISELCQTSSLAPKSHPEPQAASPEQPFALRPEALG